jgi:YfiH family protein
MEFEKRKPEWLEYDLLEKYPHVVHAVFFRRGGMSQGAFSTLNLSDTVGDSPDAVKVNRDVARKTLNFQKVFYAQQVHGSNIHRVTAKNGDKIPPADALFTTEKNIGLAVTHADCQAAIFYDPVHEAIAVAHAGWRGSAQNIYARVVETMHREIGTQAHNLIVCISPSLGPDHAEYKNYKHELPQDLWGFQVKPNYFDFWAISKKQLTHCGIHEKNIEISSICTACNDSDYFSYRKEKMTGRNATIVGLKG